jgi:hypothetical protein
MTRILDRELSLAQTREIRDVGRPVLRAVIDEATGIFERCSETASGGDENLGVLMPFHHLVEMLDGTEALLDQSCVAASGATLRSAYEASLAVRYVLQADTKRRALCYVAADIFDRIRWYEEKDPSTPRGAAFFRDMGIGPDSDFPLPDPVLARERVAALRGMLSQPDYGTVAAEYARAAAKRRIPPWYSLFGGPASLRDLAGRLGAVDDYLILYRTWSRTAHAVDLERQLTSADGEGAVHVIRAPWGIPGMYHLACGLGVEAAKAVLAHYRPGELGRFAGWLLGSIQPALDKLAAIREEDGP